MPGISSTVCQQSAPSSFRANYIGIDLSDFKVSFIIIRLLQRDKLAVKVVLLFSRTWVAGHNVQSPGARHADSATQGVV